MQGVTHENLNFSNHANSNHSQSSFHEASAQFHNGSLPLLPSNIKTTTSSQHQISTPILSASSNLNTSHSKVAKKNQKPIPIELTAYGTTPSGKPRLFVCQVCTRAFARLEHLRRHERSHTKEKPFSCGVCQRKFSRRDLLLRHAQKLHAGCADAITRLRRKSSRKSSLSKSVNNNDNDTNDNNTSIAALSDSANGSRESLNSPIPSGFTNNLFQTNSNDSSSFNQQSHTLPLHMKIGTSRRASFSAQSGPNYASGAIQALTENGIGNEYPDHVEFSTPQLIPSNDAEEWLNSLGPIPGLDFLNQLANNSIDNNRYGFHPSTLSNDNSNNIDRHNTDTLNGENATSDHMDIDNGYSFYDIPENDELTDFGNPQLPPKGHFFNTLSPIKQSSDSSESNSQNGDTNSGNDNQKAIDNKNLMNDFDQLAESSSSKPFNMPNGYSFYGDSIPVSENSTNATISPQQLEHSSNSNSSPESMNNFAPPNLSNGNNTISTINGSGGSNGNSTTEKSASISQNTTTNNNINRLNMIKSGNFTRNKLFTNNIRYMINKSLSKYPISGIITPTIPSNEKLEFYLYKFIELFLSHFPFIHISKLNEYEIMNMTSNEDLENESSRVCLPLLIAAMGSILANNKNDSENLYEASRRSIHIYLENRKTSNSSDDAVQNPLWLIQSLTLSVTYGLFSDNDNNMLIVIRQLNALNALVKSSIQNYDNNELFAVHDENLNSNGIRKNSLFSYGVNEENKFKECINHQSQKRIVLFVYRLTNFLLMLYNNPITLSINDITKIELPTKNEELLWNFKSYQTYQEYKRSNTFLNSIDLLNIEDNDDKVTFKDILLELTRPENINQPVPELLNNVGKYGLITLVHGIYEIKKLQHIARIDIFTILDKLSNLVNIEVNGNHRLQINPIDDQVQKIDYNLISDYSKTSSLICLNAVKEYAWVKNFHQLNENYRGLLNEINGLTDTEYLKVTDCGIDIFQKLLFDNEQSNYDLRNLEYGKSSDYEIAKVFSSLIIESKENNPRISIHSQMLYHFFIVLSIFSIFICKRNHAKLSKIANSENENNQSSLFDEFQVKELNSHSFNGKPQELLSNHEKELNFKFDVLLKLMKKIEEFLKDKYNYQNIDAEFSKLNISSSNLSANVSTDFNLKTTFYILKMGELILDYIYEYKIKIYIFKRLSQCLAHLRQYLIENESQILSE